MENDEQRPYSVITRDELEEKMKRQIDELSDVFCVSKSDATVLLMYHGWDSLPVSDCLVDNESKVLSESGLINSVLTDLNRDLSDPSCRICFKTEFDDVDGCDDLISTPFCSHKFCKTCWSKYLDENFYSVEKIQTSISCPDQGCRAAVGRDTIEKLTVLDQEMYERYVLRSYFEGNQGMIIKQCPAQDCNYAIEFRGVKDEEEYGLNVVCLCGHIFCGRCRLESHTPVTCNNASDWLSRDLKASKSCPHCHCPVVLPEFIFLPFITCACSGRFCWRCMQKEEDHISKLIEGCYDVRGREEVENSCVERWKESQVSMKQAKTDLKAFEGFNIKNSGRFNEEENSLIRKGFMLIVQCRQVLKWICVYDYFHAEHETSKREYLRFLQGNATALVESYSKTLKEETDQKLSWVRDKVSIETSNIGNYFYHLIKTLQDGLDEVKVKSYDNYGGLYWLCDRCTYGNTWFRKECDMCRNDATLPVELSDISLN